MTKATMTTNETLAAGAAWRRVDDLRRQLTDALARSATRWGVEQEPDTEERRIAREKAMKLRPALVAAERDLAAAEAAERTRIDGARAVERGRLVAAVLADEGERLAAKLKTIRDHDDATVALGGSRPDPVLGDFPGQLADARERVLRKIEQMERLSAGGTAPAPGLDPVREGQVRVRVVEPFFDKEWMGARRGLGITDLDAASAKDAIAAKWAVPVA